MLTPLPTYDRRIYKEQPRLKASTNPSLTQGRINSAQLKQNKRPKRKKNPQQRTLQQQNVKQMIQMNPVHPCIAQYCSALVDPRNTPRGACIPWGFPTPSSREKVSNRGTFQLGTTGQGFCYMTLAIANDVASVVTTTAASVGTNATVPTAFTAKTSNVWGKLPYSNAVLNGNNNGRFVAGGIRIRYAGTEAARNGIVTCYEGQNTSPTAFAYTQWGGDINAKNERPPPDGSWHSCYYSGPQNSSYVNFNISTNWTGLAPPLILYVQGVAGDLYEWEGYAHFEYTGDNIPGVTMTHSDPDGYAKVLEATKKTVVSEPNSDNTAKSTFFDFFKNAGSSIMNYVKKEGMSMALETVSNYLLPGSGTIGRKLLSYN